MGRVWGALLGVEGLLPAPPNQSERSWSPCRGELVGRVMGQGA